jgi:hypothetical protein
MSSKFAVIAAGLALAGAGGAQAQDITAMFNAQVAQQRAQEQAVIGGFVNQNMNNPQIVAAWRRNPRGMTLQQYAYAYAATGGFTPQGYANYGAASGQINARNQAAWQSYQQGVQNYRNAYNGYTGGFSANQQEAGRGLMGQQSYYNPANGQNVSLGYIQPGTTWSQGGYTYRMAPNGQYYATTGNGYWTPVNPSGRSPR